MGDAAMKENELEAVGVYVKKHMAEWITESMPFFTGKINKEYEISLTERIIRVEEGIKHQGELLEKLLHQMDKRFEQVDKRFEQVDKRFEQVDKRFEQIDKRFNHMFVYLTTFFVVIGTLISIFGLKG